MPRPQQINKSALVFAGDQKYGSSGGFNAGSTFKLFTLIDWLEKGHSVNEVLNGSVRVIKRMTNSCTGDWVNTEGTRVGNFGGGGGCAGTPMQFTAASLELGLLRHGRGARPLRHPEGRCQDGRTGLPRTAQKSQMGNQFSVIGSAAVSPLAMAGAYATVANNGIYCQPKAIDRVLDSDGNEITPPQTACTQVIDPKVAATAAVRARGSHGLRRHGIARQSLRRHPAHRQDRNPRDVPHVDDRIELEGRDRGLGGKHRWIQRRLRAVRHCATRWQSERKRRADAFYGGDAFPEPDSNLTRVILRDLPSVIGMTVDQATAT